MNLDLDGKLALVSGSTAGIGLAIATTLAQEGARVILNGRSQPAVDAEVASLVAYIASPLASATTGSAMRVDGRVIKSAF